ncbi:MAG TPA: ATP-binding protein [Patescibacteria group bacterium]|nr:ATP-binding protein [Patescibacteria group bacterium]
MLAFNLKGKLTTAFVAVVLISLILSVVSSLVMYRIRIEQEVSSQLHDAQLYMSESLMDLEKRSFLQSNLLRQDISLKDALQKQKNRQDIIQVLASLKRSSDLDVLELLALDNRVIARVDKVSSSGQMRDKYPAILERVKKGEIRDGVFFWGEEILIATLAPIRSSTDEVLGVLVSGYTLHEARISSLKMTTFEVFFLNEKTFLSSQDLPEAEKRIVQNFFENMPLGSRKVREFTLSGAPYRLEPNELTDIDGVYLGTMITAVPLLSAQLADTRLRLALLFVNVFTLIVAYFIASNSAYHIAEPIVAMTQAAKRIANGNYHQKLRVSTGDEVESLARSLNEMSEKLSTTVSDLTSVTQQQRAVFENIADGVFSLDKDGIVTVFNKASEDMTGLTKDHVEGKHINNFIQLEIQRKKYSFDTLMSEEAEKAFRDAAIKRLVIEDSRKISVVMSLTPLVQNGQKGGYVVTMRDVTKEQQLEEMKLDFVSMAAHELRTPITSIRGYSSVLAEELKDRLSPDQKMYIDRIGIAGDQLLSLVENLLNISRIETGALRLQTQPVDMTELAKKVVRDHVAYATEKGITIQFLQPEKPIRQVEADIFRITETLNNLIGNAINYTQKGGVTVRLEQKGKIVVTHIQDTGVGIPESALPKLFTKFFRVSGVLEQGSKGTGLGLYISKAIIDMHKGEIWVTSKLGKGSTFSFSLPAARITKGHE